MTNWKEYKVEDVASVQTGPFGTQLHQKDYVMVGTPIITVEHLGDNRITYQNLPKVSDEDKQRLKKYHLQEGDVVFSRVGSVDRRALVTKKEDGWLFSGRCLRVRADEQKANGAFLSYYFGQESFKEYIRRIAVGATMPSINTTILSEIIIYLPPLPTQTAIAEILSSLDDKIELNNKINQELENLAQTLFKQWFIDFEFPNQNGEPYKSSGGEMVDSELGEIPKGWEVGIFGEICKLSTGKGIKKKDYLFDGSYPVIGANGVMGFYDKFNTEGFKILTGRVGTLGTVRINTEKVWTSDNVIVCSPKSEELDHFAYYVLSSFNFEALNRGSTQPLLTQTDLKSQVIIIPSFNVLKTFNFQLDSQYSIVSNNKNENKELTNLRDTLLPKLISGELEVKKT